MNSRKWTPLLFPNMDPYKKRTMLAVLIAVSWTASAAAALVGWQEPSRFYLLEAAAFFIIGLAFFETRRNTEIPSSSRSE